MSNLIHETINAISKVVHGKEHQVRLALSCMLARGHLLVEDLPGMGKTTLAAALARVMGLEYSRVQFTSDMLPADVIGSSIFNKNTGEFEFRKGPAFTQVLLADEINRTTPKTQSALLEAMEERQISVDGSTYELPSPFFVIATQNPSTQFGTFPLPESQLDRFLVRLELGYPDQKTERALLQGAIGRDFLEKLVNVLPQEKLAEAQNAASTVTVSDPILDYVQDLIEYSRQHPGLQYGISPRGALALIDTSKAWAFIHDRDYVVPEDVQAVLPSVFVHRLVNAADSPSEASAIIESMLKDVAIK